MFQELPNAAIHFSQILPQLFVGYLIRHAIIAPSINYLIMDLPTLTRNTTIPEIFTVTFRDDPSSRSIANRTIREKQRLGVGWCIHILYWRASTEAFSA